VEDFHFESLRNNIGPLGFLLGKSDGSITFRFEAAHASDVIAMLEKTWKKLAPDSPFQYSFLDEDFGRMYSSEQKLGKIFALFSGLAILIACLGLFALTAFTAEQRKKEIGIRKVLGASVSGIFSMLSKEFLSLVVIASFIAVPVGYYFMRQWLLEFAYRIELTPAVFLMAGLLVLFIAWLTVSVRTIKAAMSNPVEALRTE